MTVKDDLLEDFPHVYPALGRDDVEKLLTLLDQSAGTEGSLGMSIATSLKPTAPEVASRIESYKKSDNVEDYVRMLRGAAVLILQQWRPDGRPPAPEEISAAVEELEASD